MSTISDKARFHIERGVPELREWERRGLFTRAEISRVSRQRSDFEHVLAGNSSRPADYARYVAFELNVAALVRKRVRRKGVKTTAYNGQKRIFDILQRGTRKWRGDLGLWMQYLEYCRSQEANKRLQKALAECMRLFPAKESVWVWGARWYFDELGDVSQARSLMQRALRFCPRSHTLHLEYARVELRYLAKIEGRRKVLGLDRQIRQDEEVHVVGEDTDPLDQDEIALPTVTAGEMQGTDTALANIEQLERDKTPLMGGAIPLAIFDSAMQSSSNDARLASDFFHLFADFAISCQTKLVDHVLAALAASAADSVQISGCRCRMPLVGIAADSEKLPDALRTSSKMVKAALADETKAKPDVATEILKWMRPFSEDPKLGPELKMVASSITTQLTRLVDR